MLKLPSCNFHIYSTYRHTLYHYRAAFPLGPNSTKVGRWHSSVNETPICTENKQKLARKPRRIPTNLARVIIIMLGVAFCTAHRYLNTNLRHAKIIKKAITDGHQHTNQTTPARFIPPHPTIAVLGVKRRHRRHALGICIYFIFSEFSFWFLFCGSVLLCVYLSFRRK